MAALIGSLVVPGSSERMLAKARDIEVGELVIDLEDAVVPERKTEARSAAVAALGEGGFRAGAVSVRVNACGTPWGREDLVALALADRPPDSVVVPKVEGPGDLAFVDRVLDEAQAGAGIGKPLATQALVETAKGVRELHGIACASPRLRALVLGYADLAVSLGRSRAGAADLDRWLVLQDALLVAARAEGLRAVDGPYLTIDDERGLRATASRAADLWFDGKWAIHPPQLETIVAAFTPRPEDVAHAEAVLEALRRGGGEGAVSLDGEMVDEPVRLAALRVLTRAGRDAPGLG
jgi:citrate lyase subunit beta / citryl-CoA lyase